MRDRETAKAYAAFRVYFELGDERTLPKVKEKLSISYVSLYKWEKKFRWAERVDLASHDALMSFQRALDRYNDIYATQLTRQRMEVSARNFKLSMLQMDKAEEILRYFQVRELQTLHDGKTIIIKPAANVRVTDASRLQISANLAMQQAESLVAPKARGRKGGTRPDGTPMAESSSDAPTVVLFLDGGDGVPMPLSALPPVDELDPNFNPYDGTSTPPDSTHALPESAEK